MARTEGDLTALNTTTTSLLALADDLTIVDANDSFLAAWSLLRDDILGRSVFEVFPHTIARPIPHENDDKRLLSIQELFDRAPGFICLTFGPQHIFQVVNHSCYALVGHRPLIAIPIRQALPEAASDELIHLLDDVYATGRPASGRAYKLKLQRTPGGPWADVYVDFIYQPVFATDGTVAGILACGHDVTREVKAFKALQFSEEMLPSGFGGGG